MTVVTVTPNPSVDRTLEIAGLARGEVLRARSERVDAGGKGVNVARALAANGIGARAVVPLGGPDGQLLAGLLDDEKITVVPVAVGGSTRSNITLGEPDGTVTKVNVPGRPLLDCEAEALLDACLDDLVGVDWVVGCGSLPPGAPDYLYAALVERCRAAGVRVAIDTSGRPLAWAVEAGPHLVKPNLDELVDLVGRPLRTLDEVVQAAEGLRGLGVDRVVVSLGARGAVLVDGDEPVLATPPPIVVRSDVGAGDALLAGFLAAGARGADALRAGVAWGAAAASLPGTEMPSPDHIELDAVVVEPARGTAPLTRRPARAHPRRAMTSDTDTDTDAADAGATGAAADTDADAPANAPAAGATSGTALVDPELVVVDLVAQDSQAVIEALADRLVAAGRVTDRDGFVAAVLAREQETGGTGMESGIAIPHAKHPSVREASVAVARVAGGVDFGAEDAPADLVFLIAAPAGADDLHVIVLAKLARRLVHEDFRAALRQAPDPEALAAVLRREIT